MTIFGNMMDLNYIDYPMHLQNNGTPRSIMKIFVGLEADSLTPTETTCLYILRIYFIHNIVDHGRHIRLYNIQLFSLLGSLIII